MTYTIYYIHNNRMFTQHITQSQLPEILRVLKGRNDRVLLIKNIYGEAIKMEP